VVATAASKEEADHAREIEKLVKHSRNRHYSLLTHAAEI
jgi:hypothetical protein